MKVFVRFLIIGAERPGNYSGTEAFVADVILYKRLADLLANSGAPGPNVPPGDPNSILAVDLPEDDPLLSTIYLVLREAGWSPYFGLEVPAYLRTRQFQVNFMRHYDTSDFDRAEFLWIRNWGTPLWRNV
jgi:hypothetical protein